MTNVALLTLEQKNKLVGIEYTTDIYFNPVLDINDNWVITLDEIENLTNEEYSWVKDLPIIEYQEPNWD
jgi:hypothetical protein